MLQVLGIFLEMLKSLSRPFKDIVSIKFAITSLGLKQWASAYFGLELEKPFPQNLTVMILSRTYTIPKSRDQFYSHQD